MRARSWMAALGLIGMTSILIGRGLSAQGSGEAQKPGAAKDQEKPQPMPSPNDAPEPQAKAKTSESHFARVQLNLVIEGLGKAGGEVEVKPANAGCKFRVPPPQHVRSEGQMKVELKDVEIRGADHSCTIKITVREPGRSPKTVYRGFRLTNQRTTTTTTTSATPTFTFYLSSGLAEADKPRTRR